MCWKPVESTVPDDGANPDEDDVVPTPDDEAGLLPGDKENGVISDDKKTSDDADKVKKDNNQSAEEKKTDKNDKKAADAGDHTNLFMWILVACTAAMAGAATKVAYRKK